MLANRAGKQLILPIFPGQEMPSFLEDPQYPCAYLSECFPKTPLLQITSQFVFYRHGEQNIRFISLVTSMFKKSAGKKKKQKQLDPSVIALRNACKLD